MKSQRGSSSAASPITPASVAPAPVETSRQATSPWWPPAAVVLVGALSYADSFDNAFVFDDMQYVDGNPAIRRLWPPADWIAFCPTRFVGYFTFAVNYALHGYDVRGYHVVNLAIHLATALFTYGLARRTFAHAACGPRYAAHAVGLAATTALVWVAHPLCTQAVTYIYQRLESLAALFCIAAIYAFARATSADVRRPTWWKIVVVACCFLAMATKESAAGLPLMLLLYDRLFRADDPAGAPARKRLLLAAFASWGMMLGLMLATGSAYAKAGIGSVEGIGPVRYALSQSGVILHYLRLCFWPAGLCLDHVRRPIEFDRPLEYVPQTIAVLALLGLAAYGLIRRRPWSFPACTFFLILGPTSSVIPIADLIFENRMYLPLAAVVVLAVCGAFEAYDHLVRRMVGEAGRRRVLRTFRIAAAVVVAGLSIATLLRNTAYSTQETMFRDLVDKAPASPRGYFLLGRHLFDDRRQVDEARPWLRRSLEQDPTFVPSLSKLAELEIAARRFDVAESLLKRMAEVAPESNRFYIDLGALCAARGEYAEALRCYDTVLAHTPDHAEAAADRGRVLIELGRYDEALALYRHVIAIDPDNAPAYNNLGTCLFRLGRLPEAIALFEAALARKPLYVEARANLGAALDRAGREEEAWRTLNRALADDPACLGARIGMGNFLARRGRYAEALPHFERAVTIDPANATAAEGLAQVRADLARRP